MLNWRQKTRKKLGINNFRGGFMRDTLSHRPYRQECGIINLNTSKEPGSHWVCYFKDGKKNTRIYFDSFGQIISIDVQKYLKTRKEFESEKAVIQQNTDINYTTCKYTRMRSHVFIRTRIVDA